MKTIMFTTRWIAVLTLLLAGITSLAQNTTPPVPADSKEPSKETSKETETEEEAEPGIPADFNAFLKQLYPWVDAGGEHNIFALKNPTDEEARHLYTTAMSQLIIEYMGTLGMGSTIAKLFDQYSRGKEANWATFKVLHSVVLLYYPPGRPNVTEAEKLLREAAEQAPTYAYPHFMLAQFEYARFRGTPDHSPVAMLQHLNKALELRKNFVRAVLLKCEIYMRARPAREGEVREMIAPLLKGSLPPSPDDFEDALRLYAAANTADAMYAKIAELVESGLAKGEHRVRALTVAAEVRMQKHEFDTAIDIYRDLLKQVKSAKDPATAIRLHKGLSMAWRQKAAQVALGDRELKQPGNLERFDNFMREVAKEHESCIEIEREHLPFSLRGMEARVYVDFLWQQWRKPEQAFNWVSGYLETTDLTAAQRASLSAVRRALEMTLFPTEEGFLEMFRIFIDKDDLEGLAAALALRRDRVKIQGEHFKMKQSLDFFISLLDNRVRLIVECAAFLAADTAVQIGADAISKAGEAVAKRLEKEEELNSEAQSVLQAELSAALKTTRSVPHMERGARHVAKLIEAASSKPDVNELMRRIVTVWNDQDLLRSLNPPMTPPQRRELVSATGAVTWLRKLADHMKAQQE